MTYPFQPVICTYGELPGDTGQPIPVLDPHVGGEGLHIYFSKDRKDTKGHHADGGGISVVNGSINPNGSWVEGTLFLWINDLWAQGPDGPQTEFHIWGSRVKINADGGSAVGDVDDWLLRRCGVEFYAPYQHDDLVWDANGNVSPSEPGHWSSTKHTQYRVEALVPADERFRLNIAQWHGSPNVPAPYDKPYPGFIKYAVLFLKVWPA